MMLENLASELQFLTLSGPELLFRPTGDKAWLRQKFDDIPRYLFRVFTPKSCGATDKSWTVSKDARNASPTSQVDILARVDNGQVARMLNRHLRWWEGDDNLVSWTSSLLFALVYIFHLHANLRDGSSFSDIYLCIIDTTSFSKGVFLRDVDLIRAYGSFDADLRNFEVLRESYYFGEYLSQGALKIEDKCGIVSASAIIDQGLFDLQPKLKEFAKWEPTQKPPWAKPVIRLREELYQKTTEQTTEEVLQAAIDIAQLFGPHWQLPVAANLIASRPCRSEDNATVRAFTAFPFTDNDREDCSSSKTKVMVYDALPEVQQFNDVMRSVYKELCLTKMNEYIGEAEARLRSAIISGLDMKDSTPTDQDLTLVNSSYNGVLRRLDTITYLYQFLHDNILKGAVLSPL